MLFQKVFQKEVEPHHFISLLGVGYFSFLTHVIQVHQHRGKIAHKVQDLLKQEAQET